MTQKQLTSEQQYTIALEGVLALASKTGSLEAVASKYDLTPEEVEQLVNQGLAGFKAAFYSSPDSSDDLSQGIEILKSLLDESLIDDSEETEEPDNTPRIPYSDLFTVFEKHNELVQEFNKTAADSEKKPLLAMTPGLIARYCGMSEYEASHLPIGLQIAQFNGRFGVAREENRKVFRKYPNYNPLETIEELSSSEPPSSETSSSN
jgi:hypothetical protein